MELASNTGPDVLAVRKHILVRRPPQDDDAEAARAAYDKGWTYVFETCYGGECA